jgi:Tfp pilus assembly PilM family ATPase
VGRTVQHLLAPVIDQWINDFNVLIGYVMSDLQQVEVNELYLYGEGAAINGLAKYLQVQTGFQCRLADPAARVRMPRQVSREGVAESPAFALALGLAMRKVAWL